jgi:hypothetical protein
MSIQRFSISAKVMYNMIPTDLLMELVVEYVADRTLMIEL